jgi:hypothetical protein
MTMEQWPPHKTLLHLHWAQDSSVSLCALRAERQCSWRAAQPPRSRINDLSDVSFCRPSVRGLTGKKVCSEFHPVNCSCIFAPFLMKGHRWNWPWVISWSLRAELTSTTCRSWPYCTLFSGFRCSLAPQPQHQCIRHWPYNWYTCIILAYPVVVPPYYFPRLSLAFQLVSCFAEYKTSCYRLF